RWPLRGWHPPARGEKPCDPGKIRSHPGGPPPTRGRPPAALRRASARAAVRPPRSAASFLALLVGSRSFFPEIFAQLVLHLEARVEEPAHHRPLADPQHLGQLLVAQPFHLPQQEDGPVVLRQSGQRLLDLAFQLFVQSLPLWSRE